MAGAFHTSTYLHSTDDDICDVCISSIWYVILLHYDGCTMYYGQFYLMYRIYIMEQNKMMYVTFICVLIFHLDVDLDELVLDK